MTVQYEELSKNVFGSTHMLAVMVEIDRAEDGRFSAPVVSQATGLSPSTVHGLISRLKRAELVRRTGEVTADRVAIYERRPHAVWETARIIGSEADALRAGRLTTLWDSAD